jgi:release factor glutamine methyltransferase
VTRHANASRPSWCALTEGRRRLTEAGLSDPHRDVNVLWRALVEPHVTKDGRLPIPPGPRAAFLAAIERRARGEPVSRILGRRAFWNHDFAVTPDVLDPRPDTETLVEIALERPFTRVLDLGTGSGCILISLLAERPGSTGLGTDVSAAALEVARRNAEATGVADGALWRMADWWDGVEGRFDLIVSNPPYIAEAEMDGLQREVRDWDPRGALTSGGDGLCAYRAILAGLDRHLEPGGRLLLEVGAAQGAAVAAMAREAGLTRVAVHPDLNGRDRVVSGEKPR